MINHERFNSLPVRSFEVTNPWDLGGDGKMVYTWNSNDEFYAKGIRK